MRYFLMAFDHSEYATWDTAFLVKIVSQLIKADV
jgi:hypothetical protein